MSSWKKAPQRGAMPAGGTIAAAYCLNGNAGHPLNRSADRAVQRYHIRSSACLKIRRAPAILTQCLCARSLTLANPKTVKFYSEDFMA
jgi:hypothetical protein